MNFANRTDLQARLFTGALSEDVNGGWVVGRKTYALVDGNQGELPVHTEQWPVFAEPLNTEVGPFPADDYPLRPQAELVVVGTARSRRPVPHMQVHLNVGTFANRMLVFGNRRWSLRGSELSCTQPEPFCEMDLGLKSAFGGTADYEGLAYPHPLNPEGKGFYLTAEQAVDKPLPNLERPDCLIRKWNDQPMIATWGPVANAQAWQLAEWVTERTRDSREPTDEKEIGKKSREVHASAAPPPLLLPEIKPGDPVQIDLGLERFCFRVPSVDANVRAQAGRRRASHPMKIAGLWVITSKRLVVMTWIARFKYGLRPGETRTAVLEFGPPVV